MKVEQAFDWARSLEIRYACFSESYSDSIPVSELNELTAPAQAIVATMRTMKVRSAKLTVFLRSFSNSPRNRLACLLCLYCGIVSPNVIA